MVIILIKIIFFIAQPYGQQDTVGNIQQNPQFKHPVRYVTVIVSNPLIAEDYKTDK